MNNRLNYSLNIDGCVVSVIIDNTIQDDFFLVDYTQKAQMGFNILVLTCDLLNVKYCKSLNKDFRYITLNIDTFNKIENVKNQIVNLTNQEFSILCNSTALLNDFHNKHYL